MNNHDLPEGFKMTELGTLPQEWEVVQLGEVAVVRQGRTLRRDDYDDTEGIRIIKVKDFSDGEQIRAVPEGERSFVRKEVKGLVFTQPLDVLILNAGHSAAVVGQKVGIVPEELGGIPYVGELTAIRAQENLTDPWFLFGVLQLPQERKRITALTKGGHLYSTHIACLPIPLPPLPEQRAIAQVLRTVQRAKEATERVLAATRELKKSLMCHLFTYGPVPIDQADQVRLKETELGPLPEHWEVVKLGEVFEIQQGKSLSPKSRTGSRMRPFLRTANVLWGRIDLSSLDYMHFGEQEELRLSLKIGDLLVCEGGDIGRTAIWEEQMSLCYYQNHLHRLRTRKNDVEPLFYMYWMQAAWTLFNLYGGAGNKTTIPNLSQSRLTSFPVPLPTLPEQQAIAEILRAVDRKIQSEERRKAALDALFKTLLQHLMTGKVRVAPGFVQQFNREFSHE